MVELTLPVQIPTQIPEHECDLQTQERLDAEAIDAGRRLIRMLANALFGRDFEYLTSHFRVLSRPTSRACTACYLLEARLTQTMEESETLLAEDGYHTVVHVAGCPNERIQTCINCGEVLRDWNGAVVACSPGEPRPELGYWQIGGWIGETRYRGQKTNPRIWGLVTSLKQNDVFCAEMPEMTVQTG